jgi:hypothetical protein
VDVSRRQHHYFGRRFDGQQQAAGVDVGPSLRIIHKTYEVPPPYIKIDFFRDEIITAAAGNVDIQ